MLSEQERAIVQRLYGTYPKISDEWEEVGLDIPSEDEYWWPKSPCLCRPEKGKLGEIRLIVRRVVKPKLVFVHCDKLEATHYLANGQSDLLDIKDDPEWLDEGDFYKQVEEEEGKKTKEEEIKTYRLAAALREAKSSLSKVMTDLKSTDLMSYQAVGYALYKIERAIEFSR